MTQPTCHFGRSDGWTKVHARLRWTWKYLDRRQQLTQCRAGVGAGQPTKLFTGLCAIKHARRETRPQTIWSYRRGAAQHLSEPLNTSRKKASQIQRDVGRLQPRFPRANIEAQEFLAADQLVVHDLKKFALAESASRGQDDGLNDVVHMHHGKQI